MDFAALESYYKSNEEECFEVVELSEETNENYEIYKIIEKDVIELYKAFKKKLLKKEFYLVVMI